MGLTHEQKRALHGETGGLPVVVFLLPFLHNRVTLSPPLDTFALISLAGDYIARVSEETKAVEYSEGEKIDNQQVLFIFSTRTEYSEPVSPPFHHVDCLQGTRV